MSATSPEDLTGRTFGLIRVERRLPAATGVWYACVCTGCGRRSERPRCALLRQARRVTKTGRPVTGCWTCAQALAKVPGREAEIAARLSRGDLYSEVAADLGVTQQRVCQIAIRMGLRRYHKRAAVPTAAAV